MNAIDRLSTTPPPSKEATQALERVRFYNANLLADEMGGHAAVRAIFRAAKAITTAQKNEILATELRRRGKAPYTTAGADQFIAAAIPQAASVPLEMNAKLVELDTKVALSNAEFQKMSASDRADFSQAGGMLLRSEIETLKPSLAAAHFRNGGKLHDDLPSERRGQSGEVAQTEIVQPGFDRFGGKLAFSKDAKASITRTAFDAMTPAVRMEFMRAGGTLTD